MSELNLYQQGQIDGMRYALNSFMDLAEEIEDINGPEHAKLIIKLGQRNSQLAHFNFEA